MLDQQFFVKNKKAILAAALLITTLVVAALVFIFYKQVIVKNKIANKGTLQIHDPNTNILDSVKNSQIKEVRLLDDSDHVWGDKNAPVQLIFYGDFDCPFSAAFYDTLEKVKQDYKDKVKIGFRHYPSRTVMSLSAALSAECAAEQGKFWEMYSKLFADKKNDNMNIEQFNKDAEEIGLTTDEFKKCIDAEKYDKIQSQWQEGREANVNGTPATFIDKEQIIGDTSWDDYTDQFGDKQEGLKSIIERHLSNKQN